MSPGTQVMILVYGVMALTLGFAYLAYKARQAEGRGKNQAP